MGPRKSEPDTPTHPIDGRRIVMPVWASVSIMGTLLVSAAGVLISVDAATDRIVERVSAVEYGLKDVSRDIVLLTNAVDRGVSVVQAESWIRLFRANLQSVDPKLVQTVPDLPPREGR